MTGDGVVNEDNHIILPKTVLQVIEQFVAVMRSDPDIPADAINRLETILRKGAAPKPDEINAAMFEPPPDGET